MVSIKDQQNIQAPFDFVEKYYIDDLNERDSEESQWYLKWLREVKGERVLCLGCGPNLFDDANYFGELPILLVGIDINESNIKFLKESKNLELLKNKIKLRDCGVATELYCQDIRIPIEDFYGYFDTIYSVGVLGMFSEGDTYNLCKLINRYLKPNGKMLDIDWTDCHLSNEKLKEREKYQWYIKNDVTIEKLGDIFLKSGFKINNTGTLDVSEPYKYKWGKIYAYNCEKVQD